MHPRFDALPRELRPGAQALHEALLDTPLLRDVGSDAIAEMIASPDWRQLLLNYAQGRAWRLENELRLTA